MTDLDQHIDEWTYEDDQRAERRRERIEEWDAERDDEDHETDDLFAARIHAYGIVDYSPSRSIPAGWYSRSDIDEPFVAHDADIYDPGAVLQCRAPRGGAS